MPDYRPVLYDTNSAAQVSISLDIGTIPMGYENAGKYIVTIQAHPFTRLNEAQIVADAMREAINSRLGIKMDLQR